MLAAFPLAFFVAAFLSDWTYANSANMQWANFSVWLITGGVIMALVAAIVGIAEALLIRQRSHRRRSSLHSVLTIIMLVTAIINGFVHSRDGWTSVVPTGITLSAITAILVLVTSWLGYAERREIVA